MSVYNGTNRAHICASTIPVAIIAHVQMDITSTRMMSTHVYVCVQIYCVLYIFNIPVFSEQVTTHVHTLPPSLNPLLFFSLSLHPEISSR